MSPHGIGFVWSTQAAIGKGTCVAARTAGIILVKNDPKDGGQIFEFGRKTYRKMIQNQAPAVSYNVITMLFTACVLF